MLELLSSKWKRLLIVLCMLTTAGMQTACSMPTKRSGAEVSPSLLQRCEPIQTIESTSGKDTLKGTTANAAIFWACSDKMDKLIEAVKPEKR